MVLEIKRLRNPEVFKNKFKEIYLSAYESVKNEYYEHTEEEIEDYFNWLVKHAYDGFLVAYYKNKPVGFLILDLDWYDNKLRKKVAEIHEICIKEKYKRKGVGKKLVKTAEKLAGKYGLNYICGWVGKENYESMNFFKKLSFEEGEIGWNIWKRIRKKIN